MASRAPTGGGWGRQEMSGSVPADSLDGDCCVSGLGQMARLLLQRKETLIWLGKGRVKTAGCVSKD